MITQGIILYSVGKDKCLNGLYTNEVQDGIIYNEILRKETNDPIDAHALSGRYKAMYFDHGNEEFFCDVVINRIDADNQLKNGTFFLKWIDRDNGNAFFEGVGYLISDKKLVVSYRSV